jgi:hypothetical protein
MTGLKKTLMLLSLTILIAGCTTKIPILAVRLADDDGKHRTPITPAEVAQWVDQANKTWEEAGYRFTFDEKKDMIVVHSTLLNTQPPDNNEDLWELYRIAGNYLASLFPSGKIPVFFRGNGGAGWSWGPGNTNYISMPAYANTCISKPTEGLACPGGCCPNTTLLSHELGHYFGLAHTFTGADCDKVTMENADGDRYGQLAGADDDVTDTGADPGAACAPTTSLKCDSGTVLVNGTKFNPPWKNFMTYHDCLPEQISSDQKKAIDFSLKNPWRQDFGKGD